MPKKALIIGGGFLANEMAGCLKSIDSNIDVTMIKRSELPLEEIYGKDVGLYIKNLLF
jgi:pyruvate/2-oxoglutarate dehydrogenase complex dihydrolipoamide dehydrogenase (E3) component